MPVMIPGLEPKSSSRRDAGFTLLELLVVFFIIAVLSGLAVVSLRVSDPESILKNEMVKCRELLDLAAKEAIFSFRDVGVWFYVGGYGFWMKNEKGQWEPMTGDELLRPRTFPEGFSASLWLEENEVLLEESRDDEKKVPGSEGPKPHLYFFSSGERLPFRVRLTNKTGLYREISSGILGDIKMVEGNHE